MHYLLAFIYPLFVFIDRKIYPQCMDNLYVQLSDTPSGMDINGHNEDSHNHIKASSLLALICSYCQDLDIAQIYWAGQQFYFSGYWLESSPICSLGVCLARVWPFLVQRCPLWESQPGVQPRANWSYFQPFISKGKGQYNRLPSTPLFYFGAWP